MFGRMKHLCSNCKTGKVSLEIDKHSDSCPYIFCYEKNKCSFYEPIETEKNTLWNKILGAFTPRK